MAVRHTRRAYLEPARCAARSRHVRALCCLVASFSLFARRRRRHSPVVLIKAFPSARRSGRPHRKSHRSAAEACPHYSRTTPALLFRSSAPPSERTVEGSHHYSPRAHSCIVYIVLISISPSSVGVGGAHRAAARAAWARRRPPMEATWRARRRRARARATDSAAARLRPRAAAPPRNSTAPWRRKQIKTWKKSDARMPALLAERSAAVE